jgi:23S rRNA pseudouridine2605 synthase
VGHPVIKLTRVRVGPIRLGELPSGKWRELTEVEVDAVRLQADGEQRGTRG